MDPVASPEPSPEPTPAPVPPIQLCSDNIPVTVSIGPRSNSDGGFVDVSTSQSLSNAVDCLGRDEAEVHTKTSHVWWNPGPLELIFDFGGVEYDLQEVFFWNYFGEGFDVDGIDFEFLDMEGQIVSTMSVLPMTGQNPSGANANPVVAQSFVVPTGTRAAKVSAVLSFYQWRD